MRIDRGVALVLLSSLAFGTSGPFAKALLESGWSPGAAVLVRITGAALVLAAVLLLRSRDQLRRSLAAPRTVLVYGVVAVAGVQVCYFTAVRTLPVAVALLLEYLAPVLVVAWLWLRSGVRPARRTLVGGTLALLGTVAVLDVGGGGDIDPVGVAWALGAAVCLAVYFLVLGGQPSGPGAVDPTVLAGTGMVVGAVVVCGAGLLGLLPVVFGGSTTVLAERTVPAVVPVLALVLLSTVLAYLAGAAGMARVGAGGGSLMGLSEVLFAVLVAWVLVGQQPSPVQMAGAAVVVTGIVLARPGPVRPARAAPPPAAVAVPPG